ncbi:helix-turn-helix domain-containing protein, partial [Streptomyces cinereoruber]|uniref:helix-turn-helix domain-containing protein n=1 Tax=Streptomyces cinereoruber TaxID=67260 RepID=UPI00363D56B1
MPGWKALPEELDPEVRAFTELIRRLIDRSGLGVAAVAERTGRERASWHAYLNARQPMPRGAVTALAEVTGADPTDLVGRWERARGRFATGGPGGGGPEGAGPGSERPGLSGDPERPDAPGGHDRSGLPDEPGNDSTMQIRRLDPERPAKAPGPGPEPAGSPDPHPAPPRDRDRAQVPAPAPSPGGAPAPAPAPSPRKTPLLLYVAGILGDAFRVGTLLVGAALLLGAVMRRTVSSVGMLAV